MVLTFPVVIRAKGSPQPCRSDGSKLPPARREGIQRANPGHGIGLAGGALCRQFLGPHLLVRLGLCALRIPHLLLLGGLRGADGTEQQAGASRQGACNQATIIRIHGVYLKSSSSSRER